ncbi:MAG: diacylglycerol kinase family protein [bacterium]|nr:diacylglycerol kinase family protein [bacterium]
MNTFIYDSFLNHKKYDRLLARVETRITDLGLNGKICRLSFMRNIHDTVINELRRGAKTFIVVGNDRTINQAVNSLAGSNATLGVIPIDYESNDLAKALGIESIEAACDILSARLIVRLDLGLANHTYFLGNASIKNHGTVIDMDKNYTIETAEKGLIQIFNLAGPAIKFLSQVKFKPDDGILELVINTRDNKKIFSKPGDQSVFKIQKISINNPLEQLILDGAVPISTPAGITVARQVLNVIVGKNKNF